MKLYVDVAEQYLDFAAYARGESECFEAWALGVADDHEVLDRIGALPPVKQQPALVFAAARWHGVPAPSGYKVLRGALLDHWDAIRRTVLARSTQTNEVGRLATLVPAFAQIQAQHRRPIALLEVGASAGLCLYPDRFGYSWRSPAGDVALPGPARGATVLDCDVSGPAPLPSRLLDVGWRAGIDLCPLDVRDDDAMAWLQMLVWPEHDLRRTRLAAAIEVAKREPARLVQGDLIEALPRLLGGAPVDTVPVVFHSAVIAYLEPAARTQFTQLMDALVADGRCHWVSNEGKDVLPDITATGPCVPTSDPTFVLGIDGQAAAWTHGHGASMTWLSPAHEIAFGR